MEPKNVNEISLDNNLVLLVDCSRDKKTKGKGVSSPVSTSSTSTDSEIQYSRIKVRDFSELSNRKPSVQSKLCVNCNTAIYPGCSEYLVWQTMDFCSLPCLKKHMFVVLSNKCGQCLKSTSPDADNFVCRFNSLYVFCSRGCLVTFTSTRNFCLYCQAVTTEANQLCSENCHNKYININVPKTVPCHSCKQMKLSRVIYTSESGMFPFCGEVCLETFGIEMEICPAQCNACNNYFDNTNKTNDVTWEGSVFTFCSTDCQSYFIAINKSTISCKCCSYVSYIPDMIIEFEEKMCKNYYCSILCYLLDKENNPEKTKPAKKNSHPLVKSVALKETKMHRKKITADVDPLPIGHIKAQNQTILGFKGPPLPQKSISSIVIVMPPHQPNQRNVATMCTISTVNKSTQTPPLELPTKLIPTPVPIHIPVPTFLYTRPNPKPVLVSSPYPVPVFIPTSRNTYNDIMDDISKLKSELPDDPQQADLIMMAKAVIERDKLENKNKGEPEGEELKKEDSEECDMMIDEIMKNEDNNIINMALSMASIELDNESEIPDSSGNNEGTRPPEEVLNPLLGKRAFTYWAEKTDNKPSTTDLSKISSAELNRALCRMISEFKKPDGTEYASDTVYYICLAIQKYLYVNKRYENIFCSEAFSDFVETLHMRMKAYPIIDNPLLIVTRVCEEQLWDCFQLGVTSPYNLLFTIIYNNTKYFNLVTVDDHANLSRAQVLKTVKRTCRKDSPVEIYKYFGYKSEDDWKEMSSEGHIRERNPVALLDFYLKKLPQSTKDCSLFYYTPERLCVPESPIWFSSTPVSRELIERMLQWILVVKEVVIANVSYLKGTPKSPQ